jgi:hypothetical protein
VVLASFTDQSGEPERSIQLGLFNGLVRWRKADTEIFAPSGAPVGNYPELNLWTCVRLSIKEGSLEGRLTQPGNPAQQTFEVPKVDSLATPDLDNDWVTLTAPERGISGSPAFGGVNPDAAGNRIWLDDVQIVAGDASLCD